MVSSRLSLKCLVVVMTMVGAALAVPAGAWATMPMPKPSKETMTSRPRPPIPSGVYKGTTNRGARVTIRVGSSAPAGVMHATFRVGCVPGRASFQGSELRPFSVRARHFAATGMFSVSSVSGRIDLAGHRGCAGTRYNLRLSSPAGVKKTVVRYRTLSLKPMSMTMPMPKNMFNMMGSMQDYVYSAQKPCSSCYIVGMVPNLVYPNGKIANYNTGAMLHHFVLFNRSKRDVTCPTWPQRIYASGNERTAMVLPAGYGYRIASSDKWNMLVELMSMSMHTQHLRVQVTFYTMPASAHLHAVTPMWLDEDECGDSEYTIPVGHSDKVWKYKVPANGAGDIVAIGGHVHDYGTHISLTDTTSGKLICTSRAAYGQIKAYMKNIDYMSGCVGNPLAVIHTGDMLRLDSYYNSPIKENNVMGIMLAYVAVGQFKSPPATGGVRP
jgi:hypothetical protein